MTSKKNTGNAGEKKEPENTAANTAATATIKDMEYLVDAYRKAYNTIKEQKKILRAAKTMLAANGINAGEIA